MGVFSQIPGLPGYVSEKIAKHRPIMADGYCDFLPGSITLDGSKTRDAGNPDYNATTDPNAMFRLRAGLLLGKVTSSGKYANSFLGYTNGALTGTGTTLTLASAQHGTEMARRIGATGTFKLVGPPTASGTVRALTVTYSAISSVSVTITAAGVNEVQTVNLSTAATAGNLRLLVQKVDGTLALTPNVAWSATDATLLSNLNTALDTATGVVGGIVATAIAATDTDLGFVLTYSGTGYAGNTWALAVVDTMFTSNTGANVVRTTTGVDGRFVTGSLIADTDGSDIPLSFVPNGWEQLLPTDSTDSYQSRLPIAGNVDMSQFLPYWPADASLKQYIRDKLNTYGKFVDSSKY
jgi:hypothetical protein